MNENYRMDSVDCDALKSENDLLKKRLETAERRGTNSIEDNSQLSALKVLQQQIQVNNVYRQC